MKRLHTMLLSFFILLSYIFSIEVAQAQVSLPPAYSIEPCELTVYAYKLDGSNRVPLPGASFALRSDDGTVLSHITTDKTGTVTLSQLSPGTYRLEQTSAPFGYRTLSQPLELRFLADGTMFLGNIPTPALHILHRQMPWKTALWLLLPLSLLPALVRLGVTYRQKIAVIFKNFSSLVHLS